MKIAYRTTIRKFLTAMLCIMLLLLCGCVKETENNESVAEEVTEEITEARTAIIFKLLEGTGTTVIRAEESESAYEGMRIIGGDSIVTDAESSVYFRVDDDKNILLDKESKMNVVELSNGKLSLELEYGEFFFNVENKLKSDETMIFRIGTTSMSIRGTSGGGTSEGSDGAFAIYTGVGVLSNTENPDVEYSIMPGTIAHFDEENPGESVELAPLGDDEVSPLLAEYAETNEEYKEELEEKGWEISDEGVKPAEVTVPENIEEGDSSYIGWRQNKDGSWTFNQEDFNNGVGPTYYKEEKKVVQEVKLIEIERPVVYGGGTVTYDGQYHGLYNGGYDSETMISSGDDGGSSVGLYIHYLTPKDGYCWTDGSTDAVTGVLNIVQRELDIQDVEAHEKEYDTNSFDRLLYEGEETENYVAGDDIAVYYQIDSSLKDAGVYTEASLSFEITGAQKNNYKIASSTQKTCEATIKQKEINAEITTTGKTYDGQALSDENITIGTVTGIIEGDDVTVTATPSDQANAGTYDVNVALTGEDAGNYYLSDNSNAQYIISKKDITITLNAASKIFDGTEMSADSLSATYSGVVDGDTISCSIIPPHDVNVGDWTPSYQLTGDSAINYNIASSSGTYAITKRDASITFTVKATYDSNNELDSVRYDPDTNGFLDDNDKTAYQLYKKVDGVYTAVSILYVNVVADYKIVPTYDDSNYNITRNADEFSIAYNSETNHYYLIP